MNADLEYKEKLGLDWTPEQKDEYLNGIKVIYIKRLEEPYPINNCFTAGTPKAKREWDAYWEGKPLAEPRYNGGLRREIVELDRSRLQYIIKQDESVMFRDADTEELVLVILRNALPDDAVRETMIDVGRGLFRYRRDDRREDPGMLVHFGYTCGSRKAPQIQLASPCTRTDTPEKQDRERQLRDDCQGMAGVLWNMMRSRLPAEVPEAFDDVIEKQDLPRMDMMRDDENFSFQIDGKRVTFRDLDLPPPSAMSAINYARYTHKESNATNWIVAYTSKAPPDPNRGGNFYLASYGIMLEPNTNTVSAWRPSDYHGTTLYEMKEGAEKRAGYEVRYDGDMNTGMVFEVSRAMKNARLMTGWLHERQKLRQAAKPARGLKRASKQTRYGLRKRTIKRRLYLK